MAMPAKVNTKDAKVLVIGSGPSGLVLALSLLKNNIPVRIIERDATHHNGERGGGIMPRTLEAEYFLGTANEVQEVGWKFPVKFHTMDTNNPYEVLESHDFVEWVDPTPNMPISMGVMLGQWKHQEILRRHIEALGGQIELGSAVPVDGITQNDSDPSKPVRVKIVKTASDGSVVEEETEFHYVVGADGGKSNVRKTLGIDFVGETRTDAKIFLVDAYVTGLNMGRGFFRFGADRSKAVMLRSTIEENKYQIVFASADLDGEAVMSLPKDENHKKIQDLLTSMTGRGDLKVEKIVWQGEWRPNLRIASSFSKGRVFIVGDAAHTHSPTGGQGMNSSIQDSFNLAWKLALVLNHNASPSLLDTYNAERQPVIAEMLNLTTDLYHKNFNATVSSIVSANSASKQQESANPSANPAFSRGKKLFMMGVNCRWSDVVYDERYPDKEAERNAYGISGEAVRAGDRAPDAPALKLLHSRQPSAVSRLFDVFNPALHTALVFAADPAEACHLLSALKAFPADSLQNALILPPNFSSPTSSVEDADFVFVDSEKHASNGYSLDFDKATAVIVRPDAVVGAFASSPEGVKKYVDGLFKD